MTSLYWIRAQYICDHFRISFPNIISNQNGEVLAKAEVQLEWLLNGVKLLYMYSCKSLVGRDREWLSVLLFDSTFSYDHSILHNEWFCVASWYNQHRDGTTDHTSITNRHFKWHASLNCGSTFEEVSIMKLYDKYININKRPLKLFSQTIVHYPYLDSVSMTWQRASSASVRSSRQVHLKWTCWSSCK